jgi:hypothetical protein
MQSNSQPHYDSMFHVVVSELEPQAHNQDQQDCHLKQEVHISLESRIGIEQSHSLSTFSKLVYVF